MTRVVFFGTSNFAATILKGLQESKDFEVVAVVTQPDKPVGRKQETKQSPVSEIFETSKTLKPTSLKNAEVVEQLKKLDSELFVVAAYGKIIPQEILDIPKLGSINVHGSLLPKYRGASPIQAAILNGETETGVTIMLMDSEMDHGDILSMESLEIGPNDTYPILEDKMAVLGQNLLLKTLLEHVKGHISPTPQDHSKATYTKILEKSDGHILWTKSASEIYNQYRAFYTWPWVWTTFEGKSLKILKCAVSNTDPEKNLNPGEVFEKEKKYFVVCGNNSAIQLIEVQPESGRAMSIESFVAGRKNFVGSHLGAEVI